MTASFPILLCMTLTSMLGSVGVDVLIPGHRKVKCDVSVDVTSIQITPTGEAASIVWLAEVGFGFGESTFHRLNGTQLDIPFHHYGATRLLGVPTHRIDQFLAEKTSATRPTTRETEKLPAGVLATPRLGGGYVTVPEADATRSMKLWLKASRTEGGQLSVTTVRTDYLDEAGRLVEPGSSRFLIMTAIAVSILAALALLRFRRKSCCAP